MKIKFILFALACFNAHASISIHTPPDGRRVIATSSEEGHLYQVDRHIYVQTTDNSFIQTVQAHLNALNSTPSGREIIRQINDYAPIARPGEQPAYAIDAPREVAKQIHLVFRLSLSGWSRTRPLLFDPGFFANASNGLGVPAVIYLAPRSSYYIPDSFDIADTVVDTGHQMLHGRDYLTGSFIEAATTLIRSLEGQERRVELSGSEISAAGLAYSDPLNPIEKHIITQERLSRVNQRMAYRQQWVEASRLSHSSIDSQQFVDTMESLNAMNRELAVSEFHLAIERGAPVRDMVWPKEMFDYQMVALEADVPTLGSELKSTVSSQGNNYKMFKRVKRFMTSGAKPALVLNHDYLTHADLKSISMLDAEVFRMAAKYQYPIYVTVPENLSPLESDNLQVAISARQNLLEAYASFEVQPINTLTFSSEGIIAQDLVQLSNRSHVVLFGMGQSEHLFPIAQSLKASFNPKLMISRASNELTLNPKLSFERAQEWQSLMKGYGQTEFMSSQLSSASSICLPEAM